MSEADDLIILKVAAQFGFENVLQSRFGTTEGAFIVKIFTIFIAVGGMLFFLPRIILAKELSFPAKVFQDNAIINVKSPPYNATGSGNTAGNAPALEHAAIQKAIYDFLGSGKTIYFPSGTYAINQALIWKYPNGSWGSSLSLLGQNSLTTTIRLVDNSAGFTNAAQPKGVIVTASDPAEGTGNNGFLNSIQNLAINTGSGNFGAIGIDFLGNNVSGIQDVIIKSGDGNGIAGIACLKKSPGPSLFKNIQVDGFDYGFWIPNQGTVIEKLSLTFEHIKLSNQKKAGIRNEWNILTIRDLQSNNAKPAIDNADLYTSPDYIDHGSVSLIDANLSGGSADNSAILNAGHLFTRNLTTSGYIRAIRSQASDIPGKNHVEYASGGQQYVSNAIRSLFPSPQKTLNLPVRETPEYFDLDASKWAEIPPPNSPPADDWANIQTAIDNANASGKTTLWFHPGEYLVGNTLQVTGKIRHILGMGTRLAFKTTPPWISPAFSDPLNPKPLFKIMGMNAGLRIENLTLGNWIGNPPGLIFFHNVSSQPLTLSRIMMWGPCHSVYHSDFEPKQMVPIGDLFLEDVGSHNTTTGWFFNKHQKIWARQFDTEGHNPVNIVNNGGQLWILGLKTESETEVLRTTQGGKTELLGGMLKNTSPSVVPTVPAFTASDASLSLTYVDNPQSRPGTGQNSEMYPKQVQETRSGVIRFLGNGAMHPRWDGNSSSPMGGVLSLFVGYPVENKMAYLPGVAPKYPLLMDKTEVTQESYATIMNANPSNSQSPGRPVETITRFDAILYCNKRSQLEGLNPVYAYTAAQMDGGNIHCIGLSGLSVSAEKNGYRLPTAEEWQYAYHAGSSGAYYWGSGSAENHGWFSDNAGYSPTTALAGGVQSHPVGQKQPNPWDLYDMAGNLNEWVWSTSGMTALGGDYTSPPSGLAATSGLSQPENSTSPRIGFRVIRKAPRVPETGMVNGILD